MSFPIPTDEIVEFAPELSQGARLVCLMGMKRDSLEARPRPLARPAWLHEEIWPFETAAIVERHLDEPGRRAYASGMKGHALRAFHDYMRAARDSADLYDEVGRALNGPFRNLPLLTIFGERNDPLGFQVRWKALFPEALQVVVAKGNHYPMCDDPDLVAGAIRSWHHERVAPAVGP